MKIRWRGLELPSRVAVDRETRTATYGRFVAEPFERGLVRLLGTVCVVFCCRVWRVRRSRGRGFRAFSMNLLRFRALWRT
jgi:hypothetical protein